MQNTLSTQDKNCQLAVSIAELSPDSLTLSYTFSNGADRNVYLFNQPYTDIDDEGIYQIAPNQVSVERTDQGAVIAQKMNDVPPFVLVEKRIIPCVTLVSPGNRCERTIQLPLPLREWTPYSQSSESSSETETLEMQVFFELGFFLAGPGGDDLAEHVPSQLGPALIFDPFPIGSQVLLRVGPLGQKLPFVIAR